MRNYIIYSIIFLLLLLVGFKKYTNHHLPLQGFFIIVDPGHGGKDPGTVYGNIYEKDINLLISKELIKTLSYYGASVNLTRSSDYDLSSPNAYLRKRSDFDNRIQQINNYDLYLSIHLNYLPDSRYSGGQVFYERNVKNNKLLANKIQNSFNQILNSNRVIKLIPDLYMYKRLKIPGVLIECGFMSNAKERNLLLTKEYQKQIAWVVTKGLINYINEE